MSVHLICLEQVRRDAARRAGLSAIADPCIKFYHLKTMREFCNKVVIKDSTMPQARRHPTIPF